MCEALIRIANTTHKTLNQPNNKIIKRGVQGPPTESAASCTFDPKYTQFLLSWDLVGTGESPGAFYFLDCALRTFLKLPHSCRFSQQPWYIDFIEKETDSGKATCRITW